MSLEQIDRELADWRARLSAASANLMELMESSTYRRLTGKSGPPVPLTGVTAQRVEPALGALADLLQSFAQLFEVIDQAAEIRKGINRIFVSQERIKEITDLLNGTSVKLAPIRKPLADRGLMSPAQETRVASLTQIVQELSEAFDGAKAVVLAVDDVWNRVEPGLGQMLQAVARLERQVLPGDSVNLEALARARTLLDGFGARLTCDPLGVKDDLDHEVMALTAGVEARLEAARQERKRLAAALEESQRVWDQLRELHARCNEAAERCQARLEKIPTPVRKDPNLVDQLSARLQRMSSHLGDGSWTPEQVAKGLEGWRAQHEAFMRSEQEALAAFEAALEEREELRGLWLAYRARAEKRKVIEDSSLTQLSREIESLLHGAQRTPTAQLRTVVDRYRVRVAELTS